MSTTISIIDEFGNRLSYAMCGNRGFRRSKPFAPWYTPTRLERMAHPDADRAASASLGGAAFGAVVAGPVGAILGGTLLGSSSKVFFSVETAEGETFLCRCSQGMWPSTGKRIRTQIERSAMQTQNATAAKAQGLVLQRPLGARLTIGIWAMPIVFAWFTLRKGYSTSARVVSFSWMGVTAAMMLAARH